MRVVLLTRSQPNQTALANKIAAVCDLAGIVISRNLMRGPVRPYAQFHKLVTALELRTFGRSLRHAWLDMQAECDKRYPALPRSKEAIEVDNINDPPTIELIKTARPNAVLVSGTNLLRRGLIESCAGIPIMNLHTGISPYIKGGPNCTNWCLAEQSFHLIGSTVMWLDIGIDAGDIVTTERTPLTFQESLSDLHRAVIDHSHDLYVRCVREFEARGTLGRQPQHRIGEGRTFYSKDWNGHAIRRAVRNFRRHYSPILIESSVFREQRESVRLVALRGESDHDGERQLAKSSDRPLTEGSAPGTAQTPGSDGRRLFGGERE